jgi:ATP-dependent helicase/nuclease subunit B
MNHSLVKHLILLPTRHLLHKLRKQFLEEHRGLFDVKLSTFDDVAHMILHEMDRPVIPLDSYGRKKIVQHLLQRHSQEVVLKPFREAIQSQGLLTALIHQIGEIKRAGFTPEEWYEKVTRFRSDKAKGIAFLYEKYQQALYENEKYILTDAEETLILAYRHYLNHPQLFRNLHSVTVDHFTDFTPLQLRLLNLLIDKVSFSEIRFPFHPDRFNHLPHLQHVYSSIVDQLQSRGMKLESSVSSYGRGLVMRKFLEGASEVAVTSALHSPSLSGERQHLQNLLLQPTRERLPATDFVEFLPACDPKREVESIAKEMKRLILQDFVDPSQIAVILRDDATYQRHVDEIFNREGIPCSKEQTVALHEVPWVRQWLALCRVPQDRWHRHTLLKLAEGGYIHWQHPPMDGLLSWVQKAAIVNQKETWFRRIEREKKWLQQQIERIKQQDYSLADEDGLPSEGLADRENSILTQMQKMDELSLWITEVEQRVSAFASSKKATVDRWLDVMESMLMGLGIEKSINGLLQQAGYTTDHYFRDRKAKDKLTEVLAHVRRMNRFLPAQGLMSWSDFLQDIENLLRLEQIPISNNRAQGVYVLDPSGARGDRFHTVFVLGMNEGVFPSNHREQWLMDDTERLLYGEEDASFLPASHFHNEMEHVFFWMTAALAEEKMVLSFVSPEANEKVLLSPFIDWLKEHLEEGDWVSPKRFSSALKTVMVPEKLEEVTSRSEALRWMVLGKGHPNQSDSGALPDSKTSYIIHSIKVEYERYAGPFSPWDGFLQNPEIHQTLSQIFSSERKYSVSLINEYASCPYRFFMARILNVRPIEENEEVISPLEKGNLLHEVLRRLFVGYRGDRLTAKRESEALELMEQLFDEECNKLEQWALFRDNPLWPLEKEKLWNQLKHWLEYELNEERSEQLLPTYFEFSFGLPLDERTDPNSLSEPVFIQMGEESIPFYGRIDRVDLANDGFVIYDYKLSLARYKGYSDVKNGKNYQLPIYLRAFSNWLKQRSTEAIVLPSLTMVGAGFYSLHTKDKVKKRGMWLKERITDIGLSPRNGGSLDSVEESVTEALTQVSEIIQSIRKGAFHLLPHHQLDTFFADASIYRIDPVRLEQRAQQHLSSTSQG